MVKKESIIIRHLLEPIYLELQTLGELHIQVAPQFVTTI